MRKSYEVIRQGATGLERCCKACGAWYPQTTQYFYHRKAGGSRTAWTINCRPCERQKLLDRWYRLAAGEIEVAEKPKARAPVSKEPPTLAWSTLLRLRD